MWSKYLKSLAIGFIRLYQFLISPFLSPACRFYPSCSHYARESFENHSFLKAFSLSLRRLLRCHPYAQGGVDLVP